ncbi:hypothetical protein CYMTET_11506 [Cymbomonas tetramitiformis]|uniref:Uncharacterized protein n=1 Tax=Cymbomonas tetramitiformis TaxID=36881 RepID=A0AAE0LCY3_9CHLO|nr:hypothetical protein CYMTET_11506 [Cymbomonas tetramitiformis]
MCFIGAAAGSGLYSETAPQSVVPGGCLYYQNGTVDFTNSVFLDSGTSDFNTIFGLDPSVIDSGTAEILQLPDWIDNSDFFTSELLTLDRLQSG